MPLRKIHELDNRLLREWRNANAEFFPPGPEITEPMQMRWYEEYLYRLEDHQYVVIADGSPVGTLAIDIRDKTINRVMRGRPEGKGAMGAAVCELMSLYGEGAYSLQVLEGNERAIAFYERLGFRAFGRQYRRNPSVALVNMLYERNY